MVHRVLVCALLAALGGAGQQIRPLAVSLQHGYSRPDLIEWQRIKNSSDVQSLESFVSRYPKSRYSKDAERRLKKIQPEPQTSDGPARKLVEDGKYVVRAVPDDSAKR